MKKKLLVLMLCVCVLALVIPAYAGGDVTVLGSYTDPITGQSTQFVNAKSNDAFRGNQTVIYAMTTDQELVTLPNGKKRWQATTKMAAHDSASSTGIINGFTQGGLAGLFQGAGLATGMAVLRPAGGTSVSQINQGGNANQSQRGVNVQAQGQFQGQAQGQAQGQNLINQDHPILSPATAIAP
jgi:hypothetical protein